MNDIDPKVAFKTRYNVVDKPFSAGNEKELRAAYIEAIQRYPHAIDALVWFVAAAQLFDFPSDEEHKEWLNDGK